MACWLALAKLREWIQAQEGNPEVVDDLGLLPSAPVAVTVPSPETAYVGSIDAREVGLTAVALGAGRARKGEPIDPAVGIVLGAKVGEKVAKGDPLLTVHAQDQAGADRAVDRLLGAYSWSDAPVAEPPLIYDIIRGHDGSTQSR